MATEAQRRANSKYDKKNTKNFTIKLNKNTDSDIFEYFNNYENKTGLIKQLLREHINKEKSI